MVVIAMAKFTELLESIEGTARGGARLQALKTATAQHADLLSFFVTTVNPFVTFGVQKLPDPRLTVGPVNQFPSDDTWLQELDLLACALKFRQLTGGAAQDAIQGFQDQCNPTQLKWGRRFLLRDLRLNVGGREIQKVFGEASVPLFKVPLATDFKKVKPLKPDEVWVSQPKLDGARCVAFVDAAGNVTLLSRTGKTWKNFEPIRQAVAAAAECCQLRDVVFDGEVVSLDANGAIDFQALQSVMHATDLEVGKLQFIIFDACTRAEWDACQQTYAERHANIAQFLGFIMAGDRSPDNRLRIVPMTSFFGGTAIDMDSECRKYVDQGYEGAILRRADLSVEKKRSKRLLKVKTFIDDEALCVGVEEGEGKRAGVVGALNCIFTANQKPFKMGSGLTDALCAAMMLEKPINCWITFKYFELTDAGVPRHPVFKCVRAAEDMPEPEGEEAQDE